jgi:hypothetical protein
MTVAQPTQCGSIHRKTAVPTVNPKQLSIACESVDNHGDGRSPQVDLAGLFRSRAALQTKFSPFGISSMC